MEPSDEFFDAFETIEQINESCFIAEDDERAKFNTDRPKKQTIDLIDMAEFKTDINIPSTHKSVLFSYTSLNLVKKHNKDISEFNGLEIVQKTSCPSNRCWVLKLSPNGRHFIAAGESPAIQLYKVSNHITEKSCNLLIDEEIYSGHSQSIIALEWNESSDSFVSCGIDCLVLIWKLGHTLPVSQISQDHIVTCVGFISDSLIFTGSLSKKLNFWSLPEASLQNTYQLQGLITSAKISPDGKMLVVGMSQGECVFYELHNAVITFITQINCKNRKGFRSSGKKVTGIEFQDDIYVLISTNDSRIRLYSLENFGIVQKYKGGKSEQFPIGASFSHNFGHVIRGDENGMVHIWNTLKIEKKNRWSFVRNDVKNSSFEYFVMDKEKSCSNAVFLNSQVVRFVQNELEADKSEIILSHIIVVCKKAKLYVLFNQFKNV